MLVYISTFLTAFLFFLLCTPAFLFKVPMKNKIVVAAIHAFLFAILFSLVLQLLKINNIIEGQTWGGFLRNCGTKQSPTSMVHRGNDDNCKGTGVNARSCQRDDAVKNTLTSNAFKCRINRDILLNLEICPNNNCGTAPFITNNIMNIRGDNYECKDDRDCNSFLEVWGINNQSIKDFNQLCPGRQMDGTIYKPYKNINEYTSNKKTSFELKRNMEEKCRGSITINKRSDELDCSNYNGSQDLTCDQCDTCYNIVSGINKNVTFIQNCQNDKCPRDPDD